MSSFGRTISLVYFFLLSVLSKSITILEQWDRVSNTFLFYFPALFPNLNSLFSPTSYVHISWVWIIARFSFRDLEPQIPFFKSCLGKCMFLFFFFFFQMFRWAILHHLSPSAHTALWDVLHCKGWMMEHGAGRPAQRRWANLNEKKKEHTLVSGCTSHH